MKKGVKRLSMWMAMTVLVLATVIGIIPTPVGEVTTLKAQAAETITPTEPKAVDNVYQIGTKEELYWFAGLVNGTLDGVNQNYRANAVLTDDITVNKEVLDAEGSLSGDVSGYISWTPIGKSSAYSYSGTFDGNGYVISGLYCSDSSAPFVGFFGANDGMIKNVSVVDSYFSGSNRIGSIVANNGNVITNCYSNCMVVGTGDATHYVGGFCGYNANGMITNCLSTSRVTSTGKFGGLFLAHVVAAGELMCGVVENCYYLADSETDSIDGTSAQTEAQLKSGETAYLLQGIQDSVIWGQTINEDAYPVLSGAKVYYSEANGYYNDTSIVICEHSDENLDGCCDEENCDSYVAQGACGASMTWYLDMEAKTLTINGSGYMTTYMSKADYPWYKYIDKFTSVIIAGEVKSIGDYAFDGYAGIQGVDIQSDLEVISQCAFQRCSNLTTIAIPASVKTVESYAFYNCAGLETIYYDQASIDTPYTFPAAATHYRAGGTCGETATWDLTPTYTLIISGTGAVTDNTGWSTYTGNIVAVEVAGEITAIAEGMFTGCSALTTISYGGDCKDWYDFGSLGYEDTVTVTAATHTSQGGEWCSDADSHWHECYCGGKADLTAHEYTEEVIADTYKAGEADCTTNITYYYSCVCGATGTDTFEAAGTALGHTDRENSDGYCDTCGVHAAEGKCGTNVTWSYENGILTISGTGPMYDYWAYSSTPWYEVYDTWYNFHITKIIIEEGVTSIGTQTFYQNCEKLTEISIADSVTTIGIQAIANCPLLETITLPKNVTTIGVDVFKNCPKLTSIVYGGDCATWHTFTGLGYPEITEVSIVTHNYTEMVIDEAFLAEPAGCTTNAQYFYSCKCGLKGTETFEAEDTAEHDWNYYVCCKECDEVGYVVAGVEELCGSAWNTKDVNNVMTENNGIYTKVYKDVPEGVYQLKVAKNDEATDAMYGPTWYSDTTHNNITFSVLETSDVTVTFDKVVELVTVSGIGVTYDVKLKIDKMIAVGNGSENWLNEFNWDPTATVNAMTEVADYVYQIQYTGVAAGDNYQFKFAANGSWAENWGDNNKEASDTGTYEAVYGGDNIYMNTTGFGHASSTIILTLDLTEFDYNTKTGAKYTVEVIPEHTDTGNDGYCDECSTIIDGIGARVAGNSLTLDGKIGVNFYMELDADVIEDATAYMEFVLPDGSKKQVPVSEARVDDTTVSGKTYYVFRCDVAAKEMTSDIQATMYLDNGTVKGTTYTYTVEDYASYIIENAETNNYSAEIVALVKAMLNYGATAQNYFDYETDNLTTYWVETAYEGVGASDLASYAKTCGAAITNITYMGSSTVLETDTAIRHYFTLGEGQVVEQFSFVLSGSTEALTATAKNGMYYVEIPNIAAQDMDEKYTLTVTDGTTNETFTIEYGVFSYLYDALSAADEVVPVTLKNVARAAYQYSKAAEAYFSSLNSN